MTARVELPHPHLIWLRSAATLVISAVIGQAGFAAAAIGRRDKSYFFFHAIGAGLTLTLAIGCAICFTVLRRTAGRVLLWLAWATAAAVVVQFGLGKLEIADWHIFLGVLIAMLTTALTSWTYRRPPPTG
jgi:hypothetical protein